MQQSGKHSALSKLKNDPENFIWCSAIIIRVLIQFNVTGFSALKHKHQGIWGELSDKPWLLPAIAYPITYPISCLLSAALELPRCFILWLLIYQGVIKHKVAPLQMQFLIYSKETNRQAATITPVQLSGNEIYKILKKSWLQHYPHIRD